MTALTDSPAREGATQPVVQRLDAARFAAMAADWTELLGRADCNRLFLGWEWQYSWWETWGDTPGYELVLLGCYLNGRLIALAPLYSSPLGGRRPAVLRRMQFIGNAWQSRATVRTEYLEFILDRDAEAVAFRALWDYLHAAVDWDDLVLCDCATGSAFHRRVREHCAGSGATLIERAVDRGVRIDTRGDYTRYLGTLGRSTRGKIRRDRARLQARARLEDRQYPADDPDAFFAALNGFHARRWGKPCFTGDSLDFHLRLLRRCGSTLRPRLEGLVADGETVSVLYNIAAGNCLLNLQSGFDERRHAPVSIGTVHLARAIEAAHDDPQVDCFDLLAGTGRRTFYKSHFGGTQTRFCTLQVVRNRLQAFALRSYLRYRPAIRRLRRRLLPAARRQQPARVVITGADSVTGLITARALRDLPVALTGVAGDRSAPACGSRCWSELHTADESGYADLVLDLGRQYCERYGHRPVLLVTQDVMVIEVARRHEEFARRFRMIMPGWAVTETLMDKTRFHHWARAHGCRVPDSLIVATPEELAAARRDVRFPVICKPLVRTPAWDRHYPRDKFIMLRDGVDFERMLADGRLFEWAPRYLLQQWIPGDDTEVFFCLFLYDERGIEVAGLPGRKLFQWPVAGGSTALCVDLDDPALLEHSRGIMSATGVTGLCSIEFKRHANTGDYYITEPTVGRNDLQSYIANMSGINLTRRYVEYLLDLPGLVQHNQRAGCWMDELSMLRLLRSGAQHGLFGRLRRGVRGRRCGFTWFDPRDPGPGLRMLGALMRGKAGR